jgi:hypothetical protein
MKRFTHYVIWTEFHGLGVFSRHYSSEAAERSMARYLRITDCVCGCLYVITAKEYFSGQR